MIQAAVCDDERRIRESMETLLREYPKEEIRVHLFAGGEALLAAHQRFDVIFLDIDMAGMNGIAAAKQIRLYDKQVKIIYLTNYRDYVGSAFAVHAFGYLLKPVETRAIYRQMEDVLDYREKEAEKKEVEFDTAEGVVRLDTKEIIYFEYVRRSIRICAESREYWIKETMAVLAERMQTEGFEMPHKSFCVNLYQVKRVKGYEIEMMNGEIIPLSQKKSVGFRQRLNDYISGQIR